MAIKKQLEEAGKKIKDSVYQQMVNRYVTTGQYEGMTDAQRIHMLQNPETAKVYQQYGQRKAQGGGVTAQEIQTLTDPSFYTPESYDEFDKDTVRQAIIDQTAFTDMHRNEGYWDVETNDPSWWSDAYLAEQLGYYEQQLPILEERDAMLKYLKASYDASGFDLHNMTWDELLDEMGGNEDMTSAIVEDWLRAYNLSVPADSRMTWDQLQAISDPAARTAVYNDLQKRFAGTDFEKLFGEIGQYEEKTYRKERALKEQENRQTQQQLEALLNDPQYRNTMALATGSGPVTVEGETYSNLFLWAQATGNGSMLAEYEEMGYGFMTPEELVTYQRLYEINQGDAARYLDALSRELLYRRSLYRSTEKSLKATDGFFNGALSWAEALATPIENILTGDILQQTYHTWKGDADPNAHYFDALNDQTTIRTAQSNEIEKNYGSTASFFYEAFNSVADVALTTGLDIAAGGTGLVNAGLNATKAYSGRLQSNAARDVQGLWSLGQALGDAGIEALFERLGFDGSAKSGDAVWNFLKNAFGEGAEEFFSNAGTTAFDELLSYANGHDSELMEQYKAYVLAGEENPGMAVALSKAGEMAKDFVMGGIAGGVLGGVSSAGNYLSTRSRGKAIAKTADTDAVLEIAQSMPEGSESRKLAKKYFPQTLDGDVAAEKTTESGKPKAKEKKPSLEGKETALDGEAAPEAAAEPQEAAPKETEQAGWYWKHSKDVPVSNGQQDFLGREKAIYRSMLIELGETEASAESKAEDAAAMKYGMIQDQQKLDEVSQDENIQKVLEAEQQAIAPYAAQTKAKKPTLEGKETALDGEVAPEADSKEAEAKAKKPSIEGAEVALDGEAVPDATAESTREAEKPETKDKKKANKPKLSFYQLGKLTQALEVDLQEEHSRITNDVMDSAIANRLMELGDDAATARKNAPIVRKVYRGQEVALTERTGIAWNKNASQVARELASTIQEGDEGRVGKSWQTAMGVVAEKATAPVRDMKAQLREALTNKKSHLNTAINEAKSKAAKVSKHGKNLTSKMVTIADGESGTESQGEFRRFKKHGKIMEMVIFSDGAEKTVSVEDMTQTEGAGMAEIIEYVAGGGTHIMSETEANTLASVYQSVGGDAGRVIRGYEMVYLSGYSGLDMPVSVLPDAAAQAVYDAAKAEAETDEQNRVASTKAARKATKGLVTFLGKVTKDSEVTGAGSEVALSEAMEGMTESQKLTVEAVTEFSKQFKINTVLFESEGEGVSTMQNGSYDASTHTVYIDINSGANSTEDIKQAKKHGTLGYAMMRTLGHEVTHAIEATSASGYAAYKAAVKGKLGKDWSSLVQEKLGNALNRGQKLTLQGAEAEVVADASEHMLQDSKFVETIDKSVRGRVKAVISNFVERVRGIFNKLSGGHRESRALRRMEGNVYHYLDNLQQLWDVAAEEMVSRAETDTFDETESYDVELTEAEATEETPGKSKQLPKLPVEDLDLASDAQYSYAGRGSETANKSLLQEAVEMEFDDADPETIRQATGWFRGMDGQWRYEIDDSKASYKAATATAVKKLSHIYNHPVLFEAYPELAETPVEVTEELPDGVNAGTQGKKILLNTKLFADADGKLVWSKKNKNTLLHEIQHLIQKEEGFAEGSNVSYWADKLYPPRKNDRLIKRLNKQIDELYNAHTEEEWSLLMQHEDAELAWANLSMDADPAEEERLLRNLDRLTKELNAKVPGLLEAYRPLSTHLRAAIRANREMTAQELYQKTAGEIEARDAAERRAMTAEERKATLPTLDEDAVFAEDVTRPVQFSTRYVDNQPVVWVENNILTEKPTGQSDKAYIKDYLISHIDDVYTIIESGSKVYPAKQLPQEYLYSKDAQKLERYNRKLFKSKLKMVEGIGEMIEIATNRRWEKTRHQQNKNAKYGVYRYDTRIAFQGNNGPEAYTAELVILNADNGKKYLYDIVGIKKDDVTAKGLMDKARGANKFAQQTNAVNSSIPQSSGAVNSKIQQSARDLPTDAISIREYLGSMEPTDRMTETERDLLGRYQAHLKTLGEKEAAIAEQEEIIRTAPLRNEDGTLNAELQKAKNRIRLLREQAARETRALNAAESSKGFARLMATSRQVVDAYLLGASGSVADAADALDAEVDALTKRLKTLAEDITRTAEGQKAAFARGLYDQKQLNAAAKSLKDAYGSRMSVSAIADRLALCFGELYANPDSAEAAKKFVGDARELAMDILQGHKYRYKSEVLPLLKEKLGTISLTEIDLSEIRNAGLTLTEYKRMLSPYVTVAAGGSDLSSAVDGTLSYGDGTLSYGDGTLAAILGEDVEGNLAMRLYEVISNEKAKEAEIGTEGKSEGEMIIAVMADIAGTTLPVSEDGKTIEYLRKELQKHAGESVAAAQLVDEAIAGARKVTGRATRVWTEAARNHQTAKAAVEYYRKLEEQRRVTELREQKQDITEQLRSEYAKRLEEKVQKKRDELREREQKAREYRATRDEVNKLRRKIGRKVKRLNALRVRETDVKHVPQEFQHIADVVMQTFTDNALGRLAFSAEHMAALGRRYRILQELESDMSYYWDPEIAEEIENLQALGEAYTAIRERGEGVPSHLSLQGVELEVEILQGVDSVISNVLHMIDGANDAFIGGRTETFNEYAAKTGMELLQKKDYRQLRGGYGETQRALDEWLRTGNMTPVYFMEHLDSPMLQEIFDEVRKGQAKYARIVAEGKAFVQEAKERYHYGSWVADGKLTMKTSQGHTIELTREEAAELYAIAKRERTNKLYQTEHLIGGGFQFKDVLKKKGKGLQAAEKTTHQLDAADIARIENWLTDEQRAYADALVGFLSTTMADYGNEAAMAMFGYRKFTEAYYIPFKTAAEQRFLRGDEGPGGEDAGTGRVKNSGFTKKLQHKANATLVVGGITDTVTEHIHKMATYAALVEPIENMKRMLNYKMVDKDGTTNTIRALIGKKYGQASENYMTQLLKDLNGAAQGDERATKGINWLIGAFKRGAVMASASVVLQQPTAIARAMAYIPAKHFGQNPFYRPSKGTWDEMMKYSGTAVIKDMGKFDVGMGLTASQYMADEHLNAVEAYRRLKADSRWEAGKAGFKSFMDWLTAAPGVADQWTWGLIWKANKAYQAEQHPEMDHNSQAFLELCGSTFDNVIDHSQVYDSVLTRSDLMRSKNAIHKMATSFMAEPTMSINMLYDAVTGAWKKKYTRRHAGAIIGSVMASQVLAGAMAALVQAWNDNKDKRNWLEKYADAATGNILSNINPFGMIPYVSDFISLLQGYDVERADMTVLSTLITQTANFWGKVSKGEELTWKDWENFAGNWANLTGVPVKNIMREIRRTINAVGNTQWNAPDGFNVGQAMLENVPFYDSKNKTYYERIVAADLNGDTQLATDYREYMLLSKMVTEDALKTGLKSAMKEQVIAGKADAQTAIDYLVKIGAAEDADDAYWEVDKWEYMKETGNKADTYRKYDDFTAAVRTGENLKQVIQTYLDNGVDKATLAGQITSAFRAEYVSLYNSGKRSDASVLQSRLLTAYVALGYDRNRKLKDIQKWLEAED